MTDQMDMLGSSVHVDEERRAAFELDMTPTPVVRQLFDWIETNGYGGLKDGEVFLDPSAGAGVFGMVAAERWPDCKRVAIEPRDEESDNLAQHYHEHWQGRFEACAAKLSADIGPVSLAATNPPFTLALEFVCKALPMLETFGSLWLLQLDDFGQRSANGRALFENWETRPTNQLRIAGTLGFRSDGKTDMRSYSWWGWVKDDLSKHRKSWSCENLPALPAKDRKWVVRPGEEYRNA